MSQSSNDVIPTSIRVACVPLVLLLIKNTKHLCSLLSEKAKDSKTILKVGRTHLQDAVPMTYSQTFLAWEHALEKDIAEIESTLGFIYELGIGGTATGTQITAHPDFRFILINFLNKETKLNFSAAEDPIEMTQNMNDFSRLSNALSNYATTLNRISNDIRLLVSGPIAGISELQIPEIEPGSSIMPGKVNPSVPEALNLACIRVISNSHTISFCAGAGQLELNFYTPLIAHSLLESLTLLNNSTLMFSKDCISKMQVNAKRTKQNFDSSFVYATSLNPYLGYSQVSKLVREALASNISLKELILKKGLLSKEDLDKILSTSTGPCVTDKKLKEKLHK